MMKSKYSFEKRENYLMMTVKGEYAREDFLSYPGIILQQCEKENIKKVLVDLLNVTGTNFPTMDRFYMGESIAKVLGPKIKIAVIGHKEHINKFGENVAVNRGGRLLVTESFEAAESWLMNNNK